MRNLSNKEREKLSAELVRLESLDLTQLRAQWKLLYEIEAPPHLSRDWLRRAVAYRIQENLLGGRYVERLIGSIRRESLDHLVVFGEAHLRAVLKDYASYYNEVRTHLSLEKDAPDFRSTQKIGRIAAIPILGGLHHQYVRL